jgi:hypothetical protein
VVRLARWTMRSERIEGHEWGTYVALDTFLRDGTWCSLTHKSATWAKICVTKAKWRRYASQTN